MDFPPDSSKPRILHTGEGRILLGLTAPELRDIIRNCKNWILKARAQTALDLIEGSKAMEQLKR